jgi:hypothetical protein
MQRRRLLQHLALFVYQAAELAYQLTAEEFGAVLGRADARFVLQGRDENTGLSLPQEGSVPYGMREARLLAPKSAWSSNCHADVIVA